MQHVHDAIKDAMGTLRDAGATTVTYTRDGNSVANVSAVRGRTRFELTDSSGMVTEVEVRDFLIEHAALASLAPGAIFEPEAGDLITETIAGRMQTYQVSPPSRDTPPWKWIDPGETELRIHTKLIDQEVAT